MAPCTSSLSPRLRWCSASTSAPASCAGRSATSAAAFVRGRTSSSPRAAPPRRSRRSRSSAPVSSRRRGSSGAWSTAFWRECPGVVEGSNGVVRLAENVPGLEGMPFADELRERLDLPVVLENDINLAAVGERWRGAARGVDDFVFLSVGTGMGAGLVLGGELHRGRHGAAGEIDFALGGDEERPFGTGGLRPGGAARRGGRRRDEPHAAARPPSRFRRRASR